ncbi:MAG: hypothetical protein H6551_01890 [Chitinophagales bacterium]|nr:hypothetical protein [Chitinophagaceae bacterium]MCB9063874.1 hypothetical protein [Chitinophagales bacterium]
MNKIGIVFILLLACSCTSNTPEQTKLEKTDWLLGSWENHEQDKRIIEYWKKQDDSTYAGVGKFYDSTGTVSSYEEIRLVLRGNELWYIPNVSNQNDGKEVSFKEVSFSDTGIVFENMKHDFPQRIVYIKKSDNAILAYIEGEINSEVHRIEFPYTKTPVKQH